MKHVILTSILCILTTIAGAHTVVKIPNIEGDATESVRKILEGCKQKNIRMVFAKGIYNFSTTAAFSKRHNITNHENGSKYIGFNIEGFDNIEIDGSGSLFMFHGAMMPFLIENSRNVIVKNLSIDWEIPSFIQGEIVATNPAANSYDINMYSKGYSWHVRGDRLVFPSELGFEYSCVGESLVFDKTTKSPVYGASMLDIHRRTDVRVVDLGNNLLRIQETAKLKQTPQPKTVMTFKGPMGENRYAPAIHCIGSQNVWIENVNIYHALGMGFLGEKSADITLRNFNVMTRPGSNRMVSTTADATHFCNCRGKVTIDGCRFENMLDDGTNVHGTFLKIVELIDRHTLCAELQHFQQHGFVFGQPGDQVWFLVAPSPSRSTPNRISEFDLTSDSTCRIRFDNPLPDGIKTGDLVENKTWNTKRFTMRNCRITNHRARNIVIKAPGKVIIENNHFQSMMASVLLRGESSLWYESGAVEDVVIRHNHFEQCVLGGGDQAVIFISPRMGRAFSKLLPFDRNVTIEENTISTFDNMIVDASNVNRLKVRNNTIVANKKYPPFCPQKYLFNLSNCGKSIVTGNTYTGEHNLLLKTDSTSRTNCQTDIPQ